MKRDIKLNISQLRDVESRIRAVGDALIEITEASDRFLEILREQSSQAYETLSGQWEENIQKKEQETLSMLIRLAGIVDNYIEDMTDFIAPENESKLMRVDRNDIWWNYEQISGRATDFLDILGIMNSSWKDYKRIHIYNPFLSPAENELKKAELEAAEREEREKRERNYRKLEEFQRTLWRKIPGVLTEEVENIRRIYEDSVVPFENTDDEYKKIVAEEYDELAGLIDRMDDVSYVIGDYMNGAIAGMKEFVEGMWGLYKGGWEIEIWAGLKGAEALGLGFTVPESLDEDVTRIFQTGAAIISDPINMLGTVIQGMFDSADENSAAYTAGHLTADIAIAIVVDKGLGKLKEMRQAKQLNKVDDVLNAADDLTKLESRGTSMIDDVVEGNSYVRLNTYGDALRERLGPAYLSHPEEYEFILNRASEMSVSIETRSGTLAYDMELGRPGKLIIDPEASIGALRHEYRHMLDDFMLGHPGMRIIGDSNKFWELEFRGYLEELNLAREIKDYTAGKFIINEMRLRRMEILGY